MGYRSHVAYWFEGRTAQAALMGYVAEHPCSECVAELTIAPEGVYFSAESTKWYSEYPSVTWHDDLFDYAMTYDADGLCGQFIRLGEDANDVEQRSFGEASDSDAYIELVQQLTYTFPTQEKQDV